MAKKSHCRPRIFQETCNSHRTTQILVLHMGDGTLEASGQDGASFCLRLKKEEVTAYCHSFMSIFLPSDLSPKFKLHNKEFVIDV